MTGDPQPGDVIAERYRIIRAIGSGGMGAVYEAEQLTLGRRVALKVVFDEDERALARFEQEARALARISHPNVVGVFEFHPIGPQYERPVLVMELLDGESLSVALKRESRFSPERTTAIADAVLLGLEAAHERGIIHRDLKPANIFVTRDGGVKIVDFGIAKILDNPNLETTLGSIVGTPAYLAPEQLKGLPPDARTDLHALGVCLYELVTGQKPWRGRGPLELATEILRDTPASIRTVRSDLPMALADAIDRALAKEPNDRFTAANEMRAALLGPLAPSAPLPVPIPRAPIPPTPPALPPSDEQSPGRTVFVTGSITAIVALIVTVILVRSGIHLLTRSTPTDQAVPTAVPVPMPSVPPSATIIVVAPPASVPTSSESVPSSSATATVKAAPMFPPAKKFTANEVIAGLAITPSGPEFAGEGCYCFANEDLAARRAAFHLQCGRCANVTVRAKTGSCRGLDSNGRMRAGHYLCQYHPVEGRKQTSSNPGDRME